EARLGQIELDRLEGRLVADRLLLVSDHAFGDRDAAEAEFEPAAPLEPERLLDRGVRLLLGLRVVIAAVWSDERGARLQVELADEIALAQMQIDGALVHRRVGALTLDEAEHGAAVGLDDGERVGRGRAEAELSGRAIAARPHITALRQLHPGT